MVIHHEKIGEYITKTTLLYECLEQACTNRFKNWLTAFGVFIQIPKTKLNTM